MSSINGLHKFLSSRRVGLKELLDIYINLSEGLLKTIRNDNEILSSFDDGELKIYIERINGMLYNYEKGWINSEELRNNLRDTLIELLNIIKHNLGDLGVNYELSPIRGLEEEGEEDIMEYINRIESINIMILKEINRKQ